MRPYLQASDTERKAIRDVITQVLTARREVSLAFLFGSFVDQPVFRDVDVGVMVDPHEVPLEAEFDFAAGLATDLEVHIRRPVDMVVLNHAPVSLRHHAVRGEVLVSKEAELRDRLLETTWRMYADFEPFLRASLRDLLGGRTQT